MLLNRLFYMHHCDLHITFHCRELTGGKMATELNWSSCLRPIHDLQNYCLHKSKGKTFLFKGFQRAHAPWLPAMSDGFQLMDAWTSGFSLTIPCEISQQPLKWVTLEWSKAGGFIPRDPRWKLTIATTNMWSENEQLRARTRALIFLTPVGGGWKC